MPINFSIIIISIPFRVTTIQDQSRGRHCRRRSSYSPARQSIAFRGTGVFEGVKETVVNCLMFVYSPSSNQGPTVLLLHRSTPKNHRSGEEMKMNFPTESKLTSAFFFLLGSLPPTSRWSRAALLIRMDNNGDKMWPRKSVLLYYDYKSKIDIFLLFICC